MKESLGERIENLRNSLGLSQEQLAEKIGVSQRSISAWESNSNEPKSSYIIKLAKFFDISTDNLLGVDD